MLTGSARVALRAARGLASMSSAPLSPSRSPAAAPQPLSFHDICASVSDIFNHVKAMPDTGKVASYIPQLAKVNPDLFGISLCTIDGRTFSVGDAAIPFCLQSAGKPLMYLARTIKSVVHITHTYIHTHTHTHTCTHTNTCASLTHILSVSLFLSRSHPHPQPNRLLISTPTSRATACM
jgi:hypothetical protein